MSSKLLKARQQRKQAQEKDVKIRLEFHQILIKLAKKFEKQIEKYKHSLKNPHKP